MRNLIALFALASSVNAFAADTDSHQVTVEVMPINELALDGGDVYLLINTATAGEDPDPATDASASLRWTTNESNKKIVVATDNAAPKFRLFVEAGGVSGGAGAGQLELSTAPQDFVSGISLTVGAAQCDEVREQCWRDERDGTPGRCVEAEQFTLATLGSEVRDERTA